MPKKEQDLDSIVREAVDFHGHLGPFLVIGVRIGLIGLRELKTTRGDPKLQATTLLKHAVPFSCVIDGIQVTTQCTVGNGKLKLKSMPETISTKFQLNQERQVTVTLKTTKFEELKKSMPKSARSYKNIQLAREVASSPEKELFTIKKK
jgi:formylmethanofuran dehydrogenase subunit E